ncbi:hypothetical protein BH11BAC5_BH11BAC5_28840 [soil metagenome]
MANIESRALIFCVLFALLYSIALLMEYGIYFICVIGKEVN